MQMSWTALVRGIIQCQGKATSEYISLIRPFACLSTITLQKQFKNYSRPISKLHSSCRLMIIETFIVFAADFNIILICDGNSSASSSSSRNHTFVVLLPIYICYKLQAVSVSKRSSEIIVLLLLSIWVHLFLSLIHNYFTISHRPPKRDIDL
jgi:hypothetical protein